MKKALCILHINKIHKANYNIYFVSDIGLEPQCHKNEFPFV